MVLARPAFVSVETRIHNHVMIRRRDWAARIAIDDTGDYCIWRKATYTADLKEHHYM
jgi:hypothetical protein